VCTQEKKRKEKKNKIKELYVATGVNCGVVAFSS
jgi:hypothetical protein